MEEEGSEPGDLHVNKFEVEEWRFCGAGWDPDKHSMYCTKRTVYILCSTHCTVRAIRYAVLDTGVTHGTHRNVRTIKFALYGTQRTIRTVYGMHMVHTVRYVHVGHARNAPCNV